MWHKHKVSVAVLTHNNRGTIRDYIESLFYTGFVDEVLVVDIGSTDDTISEVSYTRARILSAEDFHLGMRLAVERVTGSLLIFGDATASIPARDVVKLLPYSDSYGLVVTSRILWLGLSYPSSEKKIIQDHLAFGSLISKTFETVTITDIASRVCMFNRETFDFASVSFKLPFRYFVLELLLDSFSNGRSVIQIPVEFHSSISEFDSSSFFGSIRQRIVLKSRIKKSAIHLSKESRDAVKKKNAIAHAVNDIVTADDHPDDVDPEWVRRRVRDIQKRLGSVNKPYVEKKIQDEVNAAIESVVTGKTTPTPTKKTTLEEQYARLAVLDAGLQKKKRRKKKSSSTSKK